MDYPPAATTRQIGLFVAVVGVTLVFAHPGLAAVAGEATASGPHPSSATHGQAATTQSPTPQPECSVRDERPEIPDTDSSYHYIDGLGDASTTNWTAGEILRIGANGDCSLGVSDDATATLTATTVNASHGTVTGVVDVGRGGAFRVVEHADADDTAAIAIENMGRENSDRVAVVATTPDNGTAYRENVTVPSGRFIRVAIRWQPNGTASIALWETGRDKPEGWTTTVPTSTDGGQWQVRLDGRAYLDEIAIGSYRTVVETETGATATEEHSTDDDDVFPSDDGFPTDVDRGAVDETDDDAGAGLVYGPLLVIVGAICYKFAYGITKFNEELDAIGSTTRASEVEPADWNVMLTKVMGVAGAIGGLLWFLSALLGP